MYAKKVTLQYPIRETSNQHLMQKTSQKDKSIYRGSLYALSMVIHCPNYTQRIPNVSPGFIFWGLLNLEGYLS